MSATRFDTTSWLSGGTLLGTGGGFGVRGDAIAASGDNGPGYAYNDLTLPADAAKEIAGRITTLPSAGTLVAYEDTSFTFTGPDGNYVFYYQLYVDGVAVGSPTAVNLSITNFTAAGTAKPFSSSTLATAIRVAASNTAVPSGSSALAATGALSGGSNKAVPSATSALVTAIRVAASNTAVPSGSSALASVGALSGGVNTAVTSSSSALVTAIRVAAINSAITSSAAALGGNTVLAAANTAVPSAASVLATQIAIAAINSAITSSAAALVTSAGSGISASNTAKPSGLAALLTVIRLSAASTAKPSSYSDLRTGGIPLVSNPNRVVYSESLTRLVEYQT